MNASTQSLSDSANHIAQVLESHIKTKQLDVPLLPEVAGKVATLSQNPESDALELAKLIQSDQSLAGHVMRIANSAAYSPNATLVSLQQAITRLGMNLISDIAVAASINTKTFHTPGFEAHVETIWEHALATALWSKEVARICRRNVEATFLCGLLHSIGRPVVLHAVIDISKTENKPLSQADALLLEARYQQLVGIAVVEKWEMPKTVCESIRHFNNYHDIPSCYDQTAIVCASVHLATHMLKPQTLPQEQLLEQSAFSDVNLYQDEVEHLLEKHIDVTATMEVMRK